MTEILNSLQDWYRSQCNGDWEHSFGIKIYTVDNPGWRVIIDLKDTDFEKLTLDYQSVDNSENDWYDYAFKESKFLGAGDPNKLEFLLKKFLEIVNTYPGIVNKEI